MTSQRRRPNQTQRRLAIQASSRRNRASSTTASARASTSGGRDEQWERESYRGDSDFEEPIRPSFRTEHEDENDADRFQPRRNEIRQAGRAEHSSFGYQNDLYNDARMVDNHRYNDTYDSYSSYGSDRHQEAWDSHEPYGQSRGRSELDQDLEAMGKVWSMIRQGAVRMLGEVGRQY